MATKTINLTNLRNLNNRSLWGVPVGNFSCLVDWDGGGLSNVVITEVTLTTYLTNSLWNGVSVSIPINGDVLTASFPFVTFDTRVPSKARMYTVPVTGFTNTTFTPVGGIAANLQTSKVDNTQEDRYAAFYQFMYLTVTYYPATSRIVTPSIVRTGVPFTCAISSSSDTIAHTVILRSGSHQQAIDVQAGVTSVQLTWPDDWADNFTNSASGIGTIALNITDRNGRTQVQTSAVTVLPGEGTKPQFAIDATPVNPSSLQNIVTGFCGNLSGLNAKITNATGRYGAQITNLHIEVLNVSNPAYNVSTDAGPNLTLETDPTTNPIPVYGNVDILYTATDSRGLTATKTKRINVAEFNRPSVPTLTAYRTTEQGMNSVTGEYGKCDIVWDYDPFQNNNTCNIRVYIKAGNEQQWTECVGPFTSGQAFQFKTASGLINLPTTNRYDVRVDLIDISGTNSFYTSLPSGRYVRVVDREKDSIGFYCVPEHNRSFEINADVFIKGQSLHDYIAAVISGIGT